MMWGCPGHSVSARSRTAAVSTHTKFCHSPSPMSLIVAAPCDQGFHTIVEPEPFLSTTIRRPSFGSTTWTCAVEV